MSNIKLDRRKLILVIIFALIILLLSIGLSYSIYTGKIKIFNRTETTIKTKELGLIYTGVEEISAPNIIPGMEFEKTFTVENISDVPVDYNIYMENITNEFNEDLVYVITDEENNVVSENIIPKTNPKKSYLKTTINIDANTLQKYTMRVIYKYTDEDQSAYQGSTFKGTVGIDTEKNATDYNKYKVTIDPNGGVYENSSKNTVYQLETGEKLELKTPTKELNTFVGWEVSVDGVLDGNIITVKDSDITVTAKWNLSEEAVARINDKYYASIQNAINDSIENDKIYLLKNTEESPLNDKNVILDLNGYKVTGTFTNNNKLDVINGTIENNNSTAIINNGELTLGENDNDISTDSIKVIGKSVAIEQNGTLNFYDGYIEGIVGVTGNYHEKPTGYSVFVDHNNDKDCQKIYLVKTPSNAVAITKENGGVYYYNLQDAINSNSETKLTIYLVRDFEAAYTLTVAENQNAIIDIDGHNVTVGYTITNKGNLTIKDSNEAKGILKPSVSIENEKTLTLSNININETTDANVINNKSTLNIENTMITALGGYAVSNTGNAKINIDANSTLKANKYAMYTKTDEEIEVNNGNILGIYNEGNTKITNGKFTNGTNDNAIFNKQGTLTIDNANVISTKTGVYNTASLVINDGKYSSENSNAVLNDNATTTINDGMFTSNKENAVVNYRGTTTINNGTVISNEASALVNKTYAWYGTSMHYDSGNLIINGGIAKGKKYGVLVDDNGTKKVTITNGDIYGEQYGIYVAHQTEITGGTIKGGTYGIYQKNSNLAIGINDSEISKENPEILGEQYGLYINGGTISYFDGILKGQQDAYYGTINEYPDAAIIKEDIETIDNVSYKVNYLMAQKNFCKVGETEYNSLQKAIDAVESEGTIEFIDDNLSKASVEMPDNKNITIDLKGHTYTTTQSLLNKGNLSIIDSSESKNGTITTDENINLIVNENTLEISNVNLKKNNTNNYVVYSNSGKTYLNNIVITSSSTAIYVNNEDAKFESITINTPKIGIENKKNLVVNTSTIITTEKAIYNSGTITISGGKYSSENANAVLNDNATTTINDGMFTSNKENAIVNYRGTTTFNNGTAISNEASALVNKTYSFYGTYWHYYSGNLIINGGIAKGKKYGVLVDDNGTKKVTITNGDIYGEQYGIYVAHQTEITGGTIKGGTYGIYQKNSNLIVGTNDKDVKINTPMIIGNEYGFYDNGGTISFFDGILKGKTAGYYGTINEYPDATLITNDEETIDGELYQTNYLIKQKNFCKVGEIEYNSLQKAIDTIETSGEIEFIASISTKSPIEIPSNKNITIDLKGFTYSTTQSITTRGNLTIKDSSEEKTGTITTDQNINLLINYNNLNLESGNYTKTGEKKGYFVINIPYGQISTTNIKNSKISSTDKGIYKYNNNGSYSVNITIDNSTIEADSRIMETTGTGVDKITNSNLKNTGSYSAVYGNSTEYKISDTTIISENSLAFEGGKGVIENSNITGTIGISGFNGTITGGAIRSTKSEGIGNGNYTLNNLEVNGETIGINQTSNTTININNSSITGKTNGINESGIINIIDSKIVGNNGYGIYMRGNTLTLGTNSKTVEGISPEIVGSTYGIYIQSGTVNFYDGILKGQTAAYYGGIKNIADGYAEEFGEEIVDGNTYITDILVKETEVIINETTNTKYIKLSDAINSASENDTLKLLKSVSAYYEINNSGNITLDLNGYSISTSYGIKNTNALNIIDTSDNHNGKVYIKTSFELFNNTGTLNINDISLENISTEKNIILNDGTGVITLNNVSINTLQGIKNNTNATLNMNNSTITATKTAINNIGTLNIDGGNYTGKEYSFYSSSQKEENIKNCSLISDRNSVSKNSKSSLMMNNISAKSIFYTGGNVDSNIEINEMNIDGNINNNNSKNTLKYISGTINGSIINYGNALLENVVCNYELTLNNNYNLIANYNGTIELKNSQFTINKTSTGYSELAGLLMQKGNLIINNSDLTVKDKAFYSNHYGIKNQGTGTVEMNSGNIEVTGGNIAYGIYNETANNSATVTGGTINVHDTNTAYGIYVNLGTVTLGDNDGLVSTTNPTIKSSGSTTGIGVKKVNGYFKYYDGKLMGSTDPKPDTTTESATDYEVNNYYDNVTGMNYCILQRVDEDYSDAVAQVGKKKYNSLQLAFDGATDGDTIVLLKNYTGDITNSRKIIFDLNSKTLTGQVVNNGEMTLHNGTITNSEKTPVINNKILTIGTTDATIDLEEVKIIGNDIGLEQNGTLNFYDGYVTGNLAIKGNVNFADKSFVLKTETVDGKQKAYPIIRTSMSENETLEFEYLGQEEKLTVLNTGLYKLETWGAQGDSISDSGFGGYSTGEVNLNKGDVLYIVVGQMGQKAGVGGYNGGGKGSGNNNASVGYSTGGGGATHIATTSGLLATLENNKDKILIVSGAGGGHSGYQNNGIGGSAGGYIGSKGKGTYQAQGGTQTSGGAGYRYSAGSFGLGGSVTSTAYSAGGGGAGYYGGGSAANGGSGGGSGYLANTLTNKVMYCYECEESSEEATKTVSTTNVSEEAIANYSKKRNGYARITFIGSN